MRRVVVWLLLVFLPWRLWAADAMALQPCSSTHRVAAAVHSESLAPSTPHKGHPAHGVEHAHPVDTAGPADGLGDDPHSAGHAGCTLCDVCHNTAWVSSSQPALESSAPRFWPLTQVERLAERTPGPPLKPPIA